MFRFTPPTFFLPLYHRRALPLSKGVKWHGNWGATGNKFYGKVSMSETVTSRRSIAAVDRDFMTYVHRLRIRHRQMRRIFSEKRPSVRRNFERKEVWMRSWLRKVQLSYRAYAQYATMRTLREQAQLVNKYGQASVNAALGDFSNDRERQKLLSTLHRAVRAPPVARPVQKHVVTRFQKHNARFDLAFKQGQQ